MESNGDLKLLEEIFRVKRYEGPLLRFRKIVIGLDGATGILAGGDFTEAALANIEIRDSELCIEFSHGIFRNISFIRSKFDRVGMGKSKWTSCDFSLCTMVPHMTDAVFEDCSFVGASIRGLGQGYGGRRTKFIRCNFKDCVFRGVQFLAARFTDCCLDNLQIIKSDMRGALHNGVPLNVAAMGN